ncbi:group II truncated hemoglobin [Actinoplanes oblitus]|uniref:Group II truncated hemoglobin n=1 Tax=Actinoplanes oblitus TaxID=3040509 RepID=A0ABY8WPB4_9ACTN|nr:group II truncated hemoglobin [Actinoplanes oblitus]WIM99714.1 group II truncated hemoglobin [Actinoplanes oblitus]
MTVEYIRYRIPGDTAAFEQAIARAARFLARAPQCADYELSHRTDQPDSYLLRITWAAGSGGEPIPAFLAEIEPYADAIEERSRYEPAEVAGAGGSVPSMYEWAGGLEALERLTERFYQLVPADELVGPLFARMDPGHPRHVALWLAEVFGGPDRYTRERGGYPAMLGHHLGKAITEPQRRRWVSLLLDAADEVGLPDDPEFRAAFVGYLEWGTRLALANSQLGATPPRQAPVPHWGWGVAPPYQG